MEAHGHLTSCLLASLKGKEHPPTGEVLTELDELHLEVLDARVQNALKLEKVRVKLEGSETLSLDEAERTLAAKEVKRAFPPLRDRVDKAFRPFAAVEREAAAEFDDEEPPDLAPLCERLREPAQAAFELLGGELGRARDPVDPAGGYSDQAVLALARAAREAAPEPARGLNRMRAPRALAGHVLSHATGPVRVLVAPSLRGARAFNLLEGSASALICSLLAQPSVAGDLAAATLGTAFALGLSGSVVRRATLDEAKALDRQRETLALLVLEAWLAAETARDPESFRDRVSETLGADAAPTMRLPWPGFGPLVGPRAATAGRALRTARGAALFVTLRERFDEAFAIVPGPLELVRGAGPALCDGAFTAAELFELDEGSADSALVDVFYGLM